MNILHCVLPQDQFYNLLSLLGEFVMHSSIKVKTQLFLYSEASSSAFLSAFIVSYPLTANPHILYKQLPSVRIIMAHHSSTVPS